jgi:hypothetical protein
MYAIHERFNIDGFLRFSIDPNEQEDFPLSYVQAFTSGAIEYASTRRNVEVTPGETRINLSKMGADIILSLSDYFGLMNAWGIDFPVFIGATLLNASGVMPKMGQSADQRYRLGRAFRFDRDFIQTSLVEARESGEAQAVALPLLESLWHAAGFRRCYDYDENGQFNPGTY